MHTYMRLVAVCAVYFICFCIPTCTPLKNCFNSLLSLAGKGAMLQYAFCFFSSIWLIYKNIWIFTFSIYYIWSQNVLYRYVPGGCFAVTREQIFKRSKAFYYEMLVSSSHPIYTLHTYTTYIHTYINTYAYSKHDNNV